METDLRAAKLMWMLDGRCMSCKSCAESQACDHVRRAHVFRGVSVCVRVRVCVFVCSTRHHRQRVVHINQLASLNIKEGR